jgi:hypothetical protein
MRRLFAISSAILSIGFVVALANAGDAMESPRASSDETGMTATASPDDDQAGTQAKKSSKKYSKSSKTCTMNGVTYKKGEPGFESCRSAKEMGGTSGMESPSMSDEAGAAGMETATPDYGESTNNS